MGHKAKWEYFRAVYERYRKAGREAKQLMLNEFCLNTGYNRKYAIRLLNGPPPGKQAARRPRGRRPRYGSQLLSILAAIWEAAGYPWWVRPCCRTGCHGFASVIGRRRRWRNSCWASVLGKSTGD